MFNKTRKSLTIFFSSLMMIFLLSFIVISYYWLSSVIMNDQKETVQRLAYSEVKDHKGDLISWYKNRHSKDQHEHEEKDDDDDEFENDKSHHEEEKEIKGDLEISTNHRAFYYVITHDQHVIDGDVTIPQLHDDIVKELLDWEPDNQQLKYQTFHVENKNIRLLLAGVPVIIDGKNIGYIYTGTNVTAQYEVVQKLLWILIPLSVIFLVLSSLLGYYMAGRAMIPISRSFERQREFVGDASHELRTPLSVIHSSIEVLEREEKDKMSDFSYQILDDMKCEVKRLTKLVADLLTIARSDSGTIELSIEEFDLKPVINQLIRTFHPLAEEKNIDLHVDVKGKSKVLADKERLTQLIYILLDNAIQYNVQNGDVYVSFHSDPKFFYLIVEDTGIGIPKKEQSRIFDRFYRVDKSRSREMGNNGFGLSIAKWIVESHNGVIEVESEEGKGSKFLVSIPMKGDIS